MKKMKIKRERLNYARLGVKASLNLSNAKGGHDLVVLYSCGKQ